jgi:hypothetical protein
MSAPLNQSISSFDLPQRPLKATRRHSFICALSLSKVADLRSLSIAVPAAFPSDAEIAARWPRALTISGLTLSVLACALISSLHQTERRAGARRVRPAPPAPAVGRTLRGRGVAAADREIDEIEVGTSPAPPQALVGAGLSRDFS